MTKLYIGYDSFDAYTEKALRSSSRRKLRRKLEATAGVSDIRMSVTDDAASFVDELYPLYLQVFERSKMQFEKLTKDFFRQLGQRMSDKVLFFAWRRGCSGGQVESGLIILLFVCRPAGLRVRN